MTKITIPATTKKVMAIIAEQLYNQNMKGVEKYNRDIDQATDYDWQMMAIEELIDCAQYLVKETEELKRSNATLEKLVSNTREENEQLRHTIKETDRFLKAWLGE